MSDELVSSVLREGRSNMGKPLSERALEDLFGAALAFFCGGHTLMYKEMLEEIRRRDAAPTAWPSGPQAAEQLARALRESGLAYRVEALAAAVLAALAAQDAGAQEPQP